MEVIAFLFFAVLFFWLVILPIVVFIKLSSIQKEIKNQNKILQNFISAKSADKIPEYSKITQRESKKNTIDQGQEIIGPGTIVSPSQNPSKNTDITSGGTIPVSPLPAELSSDFSPVTGPIKESVPNQQSDAFPILSNDGSKDWLGQESVGHQTVAKPPRLPDSKVERPPTPVPRKSLSLEKTAEEAMGKIGNWLLFGQEKLAPGVSFEFAVASTWLLRIGILILVLGLGFFVKYSIDNNLISQEVRVLNTAGAGFVLLIGGTRLLGGTYQVIGHGLMGGGLTTLYFSVFAAESFYHLITPQVAFFLMAMVTVLSGGIAVGFSTITVAVIGVLGGYGTPIFIHSQTPNLPILHAYMLI